MTRGDWLLLAVVAWFVSLLGALLWVIVT